MFLIFFSLKSMTRLDFIICWFSLYCSRKINKDILLLNLGKSRTTLSYCPNTYSQIVPVDTMTNKYNNLPYLKCEHPVV